LQYVEFEGPAYIKEWGAQNNCELPITKIYENKQLPAFAEYDLLLIMDGPMSISDTDKYAWLNKEKEYLSKGSNCTK
jgi:GMP synthase-like glutamine amidotransferase